MESALPAEDFGSARRANRRDAAICFPRSLGAASAYSRSTLPQAACARSPAARDSAASGVFCERRRHPSRRDEILLPAAGAAARDPDVWRGHVFAPPRPRESLGRPASSAARGSEEERLCDGLPGGRQAGFQLTMSLEQNSVYGLRGYVLLGGGIRRQSLLGALTPDQAAELVFPKAQIR